MADVVSALATQLSRRGSTLSGGSNLQLSASSTERLGISALADRWSSAARAPSRAVDLRRHQARRARLRRWVHRAARRESGEQRNAERRRRRDSGMSSGSCRQGATFARSVRLSTGAAGRLVEGCRGSSRGSRRLHHVGISRPRETLDSFRRVDGQRVHERDLHRTRTNYSLVEIRTRHVLTNTSRTVHTCHAHRHTSSHASYSCTAVSVRCTVPVHPLSRLSLTRDCHASPEAPCRNGLLAVRPASDAPDRMPSPGRVPGRTIGCPTGCRPNSPSSPVGMRQAGRSDQIRLQPHTPRITPSLRPDPRRLPPSSHPMLPPSLASMASQERRSRRTQSCTNWPPSIGYVSSVSHSSAT